MAAIDKYAARLLMLSFFIPQSLGVVALLLPCLYFVICTLVSRKPVPRGNYLWALLIGSGYILYLLSIPITSPDYRDFLLILCQRKASLLLMPLAFAIMSPSFIRVIMDELMYFVYGCVVVCIAGNVNFIYNHFTALGVNNVLSHVNYRIAFETCTGIHPTYMGMYLAFAICIVLAIPVASGFRVRVIKYGLVYLLLVFLLSLLAKSPIIALAGILVHYAWVQRAALYRYKWILIGMAAAVAAACYFIPFIGQRVGEMFNSGYWLSFGIIGILVLVFVLGIHYATALRAKDHRYIYLLVILSVTFFTETILSRQIGVLFYAVFTSLFFFSSLQEVEKSKPEDLTNAEKPL